MVAEVQFLEAIFIIFLDGLPTINWSLRSHINCVLREGRGNGGGIVVVECLVLSFPNASSAWRSCGSGVFVFWAKVGKAKLIPNPTRPSTKRIFMGLLSVF